MSIPLAADPRWPLLSGVLWVAAVAAATRGTCHFAVLLAVRRPERVRTVRGWQAVTFGLASAYLLSARLWEPGVLFAVLAGYQGVTWQRERKSRNAERGMPAKPTIP